MDEGVKSAARTARRVTWIGLIINLLLSAFKFFAGYYGGSQAVVADAVHSLSDSTTDVAVLVGSWYWSKPPDNGHPYGHRRIETLVTVFIGVVLGAAGVGIGWNAVNILHKGISCKPGVIALAAAGASMIIKEILYRWTAEAGERVHSPALKANAWHHRLDALSSVPAFLAVAGAMALPSFWFLDQIGAVVVAILILQAAFKIIWPGLAELIDAGAPQEICEEIAAIAYENGRVVHAHGIRTRYVSGSLHVDLHAVVDGGLTVREGHAVAEDVKRRILDGGVGAMDVVVHIEPDRYALKQKEECP